MSNREDDIEFLFHLEVIMIYARFINDRLYKKYINLFSTRHNSDEIYIGLLIMEISAFKYMKKDIQLKFKNSFKTANKLLKVMIRTHGYNPLMEV